ncbi:MAG: hypothetical protein Q8R55_07105 [Candidatus Taylorbacteria bacterium]|nr:hypothetical protein [Candidatus Taylorbacteria bacterium]
MTAKLARELRPGDIFFGGSNTDNLDKGIFSIDYNYKDKFRAERVSPCPGIDGIVATKVEATNLTDNQIVSMVLPDLHVVSVY